MPSVTSAPVVSRTLPRPNSHRSRSPTVAIHRGSKAMDVCSLNPRSSRGLPVCLATRKNDTGGLLVVRPTSAEWRVLGREDVRSGRIDVMFSVRRQRSSSSLRGYLPFVVAASNGNDSSSGKDGPPIPEEDGLDGTTPQYDKSKAYDHKESIPTLSDPILSDWRDFRANHVAREQELLFDSDALSKDAASAVPSQRLGLKWAHSIPVLETGCVLVATEKLDRSLDFERVVILLLGVGSSIRKESHFGVILNRPRSTIKGKLSPVGSSPHIAAVFSDRIHLDGGPLHAGVTLVRAGDHMPHGDFKEVISGVYFSVSYKLLEAAALIERGVLKAQDFKFFSGYAAWRFDQLQAEIESGYWVVAACSSHLITADGDSSVNLWEEILQLMGGQYSEMSRKPKKGEL